MAVWISVVCVVLLGCAAPIDGVSQGTDAQRPVNPPPAAKGARTGAEEKIQSRLLDAIRRDKNAEPIPSGRERDLDVDAMGRVLVDIRAVVTEALIDAIEESGGIVVNRFPQYESVRARIHLSKILSIADRDEVKSIRAAERSITNSPVR
jgi:hypothetical protein